MLGWPAQCGEDDQRCWPDADKANLEEVQKGAQESGGSGPGSARFKTTGPALAAGADGEKSTEPCPGHPNILLSSASCQSKLDKAVLNKEKSDSIQQGLCPGNPGPSLSPSPSPSPSPNPSPSPSFPLTLVLTLTLPGHPNILLTSPACTESRSSDEKGIDDGADDVARAREAETWRRARQVTPQP